MARCGVFLVLLWVLTGFGAPASAETLKLLAIGTSLTSGFGLPYDQGFATQLEKALKDAGHDVTVIDAGVEGDTVRDARGRLDWLLAEPVDGAIVELGINDAIQGIDPDEIEYELGAALRALRTHKIPTLLTGIHAPEGGGADYGARIDAIYPRLAVEYDTLFYTDFLEGVAGEAALNQPDGIHPNAQGVAFIVRAMLPAVEHLLSVTATSQDH